MPRRIKTKPARIARRSVAGKKTIVKKIKSSPVNASRHRKDMRFNISLVILIGMLTFSATLLLFSLNNSSLAKAGASSTLPVKYLSGVKKSSDQMLNDSALDFKLTVPIELGQWFYKIGEVKSLTDDSLSNQYFRMFIPLSGAGAKSKNFDEQNRNILTIRKFSSDEWSDIEKNCQKNKKDICDAAGKLIVKNIDSNGDEWVYAYVKSEDCPKNIEAKCNLADKIMESFNLK
jgi:hypothetical protein